MTDNQHRLGPPPVEPLSDVAWARLERGLWERLDEDVAPRTTVVSRWRWLWIAAPTLAVAAVIALVIGLRSSSTSTRDERQPTRLASGDSPSTLADGDVYLTLDAQSAVVMHHDDHSPSAVLEKGAAWFEVAPRRNRAPFTVVAGDTMVRVVGTHFRVARFEEHVVVEVERGLVDVVFHGDGHAVGPDQRWSSDHPDDVTPMTTTKTARADEPNPAPAQEPATNEPEPVVTPPAPAPAPRTPAPKPARIKVKPEPAKPVEPVKPVEVAKPRAPSAEQIEFNRLAGLEPRDTESAIQGYLKLSQRGGIWAEQGLYAAGRLAADRNDRRAITLLEVYLRRFPASTHSADARILLARLKGETR